MGLFQETNKRRRNPSESARERQEGIQTYEGSQFHQLSDVIGEFPFLSFLCVSLCILYSTVTLI